MQAEIIIIGTELLLGEILDTNAAYLARQLAGIGFDVYRKTTVGDNELRIADAVRTALDHSDVVITTGGLGPTVDDKTREAVAKATTSTLVLDQNLLQDIEAFFQRRGREMGENNRRQAYIPHSALPIPNPVGTAPGFIVKCDERHVICLPGVPRELYHLIEHAVLPFLQQTFGLKGVIKSRTLRTVGVGESLIDQQIGHLEESGNPTVGLAAHPGSVDIRITAKGNDAREAQIMLDRMEAQVRGCLGEMIYGTDEDTIEKVVAELLADRGVKLAVLETNTGGMLAGRLTAVPHGIGLITQGLITSPEQAVSRFLGDFEGNPIASTEVSEALARRIREEAGVGIGVAIVGDTDPNVGPYNERAGDTYMGLSGLDTVTSQHIRIGGISEVARAWIVNSALDMLRRYLLF